MGGRRWGEDGQKWESSLVGTLLSLALSLSPRPPSSVVAVALQVAEPSKPTAIRYIAVITSDKKD